MSPGEPPQNKHTPYSEKPKYVVITALFTDAQQFQEDVNTLIDIGYEPLGGMALLPESENNYAYMCQTMVRP